MLVYLLTLGCFIFKQQRSLRLQTNPIKRIYALWLQKNSQNTEGVF